MEVKDVMRVEAAAASVVRGCLALVAPTHVVVLEQPIAATGLKIELLTTSSASGI